MTTLAETNSIPPTMYLTHNSSREIRANSIVASLVEFVDDELCQQSTVDSLNILLKNTNKHKRIIINSEQIWKIWQHQPTIEQVKEKKDVLKFPLIRLNLKALYHQLKGTDNATENQGTDLSTDAAIEIQGIWCALTEAKDSFLKRLPCLSNESLNNIQYQHTCGFNTNRHKRKLQSTEVQCTPRSLVIYIYFTYLYTYVCEFTNRKKENL